MSPIPTSPGVALAVKEMQERLIMSAKMYAIQPASSDNEEFFSTMNLTFPQINTIDKMRLFSLFKLPFVHIARAIDSQVICPI
jgi:hypothetical protein